VAEIPRQLQIIRQKSDPGAVHYHLRSILENPALAAAVRAAYAVPALVPTTPWLPAITPAPPAGVSVSLAERTPHVEWQNSGAHPPGWWLVQARVNGAWTTQIVPGARADDYFEVANPDAVAVRAVDRLGNLGEAQLWTPRKFSTPVVKHGMSR
jgi:hypothetical protein